MTPPTPSLRQPLSLGSLLDDRRFRSPWKLESKCHACQIHGSFMLRENKAPLLWWVLWLHIIFAPYRLTKRRSLWSFTIDYMKARVILLEMSRRAKSGPRISRKYPAVAESQARVKQRRCQNRLWQGLNPKGNEKRKSLTSHGLNWR